MVTRLQADLERIQQFGFRTWISRWSGGLMLWAFLTVVPAKELKLEESPIRGNRDTYALSDPTHWSFKSLRPTEPPVQVKGQSIRHPVDGFIRRAQSALGVAPNPPAQRLDLIRRAYLDLTGLPPSPEAVAMFVKDGREDAWERLVDELLRSPRYGERWAQHWLDVVRYADTHGFEVNTERPNAWPYRDYVIRAFNDDRPYDQFVRDQIAGDLFGEDSATGFLVTSAVLLPGQIGADDESKRLARQDSLSEIVGATGQVFLGLSVGCARCHNHKFDPISIQDYYAMQAFFAGVEYGDRPVRTPETEARIQEAELLKPQLERFSRRLATFEPLARVEASARREMNARFNEDSFAPISARFVRFTIHDSKLHPTLGLIEPCLDEVEIFTAEDSARNVALAGHGTKVLASGSRTSGPHRLEHVNDGNYGNSKSWMSDEAGRGWLLFEFTKPERIGRMVWSRDREGSFEDRLPIAYTIEAGDSLDTMKPLIVLPPLRPAVDPKQTSDRFAAISTSRLRFIIEATTGGEPCLDELEVFIGGASPRNVALASLGTRTTASSLGQDAETHQVEFINDGRFGHSRSWMSREPGKGWVEFQFPQAETIERVVWSRDRDGKMSDRLPTHYRIEVLDSKNQWLTVAGSTDRRGYSPNLKAPANLVLFGLAPNEASEATQLLAEKKALDERMAALRAAPMVYAGVFRTPEVTRVLHRGDPEQPRDEVKPGILSTLGSLTLSKEATDPERRRALGEWISSADNPLTARVIVNRVWQWHFGFGFVETANDFGSSGTAPSHPELLDWLAADFIHSGWSIKHLHRRIMTSATYRQSNQIRPDAQAIDGDCRVLWRYPSRRLEAESIRDSVLAVSGRLNLKMGGPGFNLFRSRGGLDGFPPIERFDDEGRRRLIYSHKVRMERDIVFGAFDCPDAGQSTPRRRQSTTPIQALNLFNSAFTLDEADRFADRVRRECVDMSSLEDAVSRAYRLALGRDPSGEEGQDAASVAQAHGLPALCRALFNSNEFLFLP